MTNRLISEKSPSWIWKPEFNFAQSTIRRFAVRQNGSAPISFSETDRSPLLCSLINFARTYFGQKPE